MLLLFCVNAVHRTSAGLCDCNVLVMVLLNKEVQSGLLKMALCECNVV